MGQDTGDFSGDSRVIDRHCVGKRTDGILGMWDKKRKTLNRIN